MNLDTARTRQLLAEFNFIKLFIEELGWDRHAGTVRVQVDGHEFTLSAVAEKRGVQVFQCEPDSNGDIPPYATRLKIDRQVRKHAHEHLIIFIDGSRNIQIWQWVARDPGRPAAYREYSYHKGSSADSLIQKLGTIAIPISAEETLELIGVTSRLREAFDKDKVTKKFYESFKAEHDTFLKFIKGIPIEQDHRWYASVMLNRLMFIYFIQKKGFLDGDVDYLKNKLGESEQRGKDQFYSKFLCRLFFEGFAQKEHSASVKKLLGSVPYLNGGIFQEHQLEKLHGKTLSIPDKAFKKLFAFFDEYRWHLDERPLREQNEINPDVLGYIFEKYINQKQMGAYYTKEDITEYISKNTVIPYLFDTAKVKCKIAFEGDQSIWKLLQADPDRYIYDAIKHGLRVNARLKPAQPLEKPFELPEDIAAGINDVSKRSGWNKEAPGEYGLPTEIWREVVARRQRYGEVHSKLSNGEIRDINDLITYNLNIRQFAQDVIDQCEGPELLRAFWHAIENVTILDPTCGSGAFLFAALNILEPLYEACLDRMLAFVDDLDRSGKKHDPKQFGDFKDILARIALHPNKRYFILKSIIIKNLYGVDIMEEAVEICKLRLFLKLVAQVNAVDKVEPLPDIDFNIRAGNTLIGFATLDEAKRTVTSKFDFDNAWQKIETRVADHQQALDEFRRRQLEGVGMAPADDKEKVQNRLRVLNDELNHYFATQYGIISRKLENYRKWHESHKPFHWFIEFYSIIRDGGFNVIIGNPPFVNYSEVRADYTLKGYKTLGSGNLYAYVVERSIAVLHAKGGIGMTVPLSLTFSRDFPSLRSLLLERKGLLLLSSYDNIPDRLFTGAKESENTSKANQQRITIFLSVAQHDVPRTMTSPLLRWHAYERDRLFGELQYIDATDQCSSESFPKIGSIKMRNFLICALKQPTRISSLLCRSSTYRLVVPKTASYYIAAYPSELDRTQQMTLFFRSAADRDMATVLLNSGFFFWLWRVYGDSFHVTNNWIGICPVIKTDDETYRELAAKMRRALDSCTVYKSYKGVDVPNINFNKRMDLIWIVDEWIIKNVAPHLGVTPDDFFWAKSNSFLKLKIPKSASFPCGFEYVAGGEDEANE